jgi:hypothetical protein
MPANENLRSVLHERFRRAFGPPDGTSLADPADPSLGQDEQWSMPSHYSVDIHVQVYSGARVPSVWVFDPHDHVQGVQRHAVTSEDQIEPIITDIHERMARVERAFSRLNDLPARSLTR